MREIEYFVAWESVSQPVYKHLVKLNFITPGKRIAKKDDGRLFIRARVMLYIPETVTVVA
jgi:hypothetical protein